jgi:hypothetical protein
MASGNVISDNVGAEPLAPEVSGEYRKRLTQLKRYKQVIDTYKRFREMRDTLGLKTNPLTKDELEQRVRQMGGIYIKVSRHGRRKIQD